MNQIEEARKGNLTAQMKYILEHEDISQEELMANVAKGKIAILSNSLRNPSIPCAVGKGLKIKVNANIGLSSDESNEKEELEKLEICEKYKADAVMDLSVSGNLFKLRDKILKRSLISVGTVPVYDLFFLGGSIENISEVQPEQFLKAAELNAKQGVDFLTIHCGVTKETLSVLEGSKRILDIVSRGGAIISKWIRQTGKENPFYERFDELLDIAKKYDVTLSLGDGFRPGSVLDATDDVQMAELDLLGKLALRAHDKGVQVVIEGPGHVPLNQIEKNIKIQKEKCNDMPFYVLGPLTTDIGAGYDHITSAIGGALAGYYGADFLCYVTPAEHLRLPSLNDVREGLIASKIAAHSADIARGNAHSIKKDKTISLARKNHDWQTQIQSSIDPEKAKKIRQGSSPKIKDVCTMCSEFCALKIGKKS